MISCLSNYTTRLMELPPRAKCDDDYLRWEEQIRSQTARKPAGMEPRIHPPCPPVRLELTSRVTRRDLVLTPRALPALTGAGPANLVCGKCSELIGSGLTCRAARREHPEGSRLVIRCTCGALNLLSAKQRPGN